MDSQILKRLRLPETPGIYFFKRNGKTFYIGRATSIKNRVRSYFASDLIARRGMLIVEMVSKASSIEFIKTDSVLEAIILEAELIKKYQPYYNTKEKDDKSFNSVIITDDDFPRVLVVRSKNLATLSEKTLAVYGPFPNGSHLREAMIIIRKIFPFRDRCIPATANRQSRCFNRQIGLCPGVCSGEISRNDYLKQIKNLMMFFEGKKISLLEKLKVEMQKLSKGQFFEKASAIRDKIFALQHIQDVSLVKDAKDSGGGNVSDRIEAYDLSHTSGDETVGVMVVFEGSEPVKSEYRKFKIKIAKGGDDTDGLREVLSRRFNHRDWDMPKIVVVDGGPQHLNIAKEVLEKNKISAILLAVTKDSRHRAREVTGGAEISSEMRKNAIKANAEAHRFAVRFHRERRKKAFLG